MDAVYIFRAQTDRDQEVLQHSIRSLERHCRDLENILVVGDYPTLAPRTLHMQHGDNSIKGWRNMYAKVSAAAKRQELTEDVLLMNDDFFFTADFAVADFPFYALKGADGGTSGKLYFGVHCAMRINRKAWEAMPNLAELKGDYSPRSFYANYYGAQPTFCEDFIATTAADVRDENPKRKQRGWFSISDGGAQDPEVWEAIQARYSHASRYE